MNDERLVIGNTETKRGTPFFSIIVPVYNVAPYLKACLDSVLTQTYPNWECLCIDDNSTDNSGAILDEYARKDSRLRVFHKTNGGVASARNLALENTHGEWICFLDGDDVWAPKTLSHVLYGIKEHPNINLIRFEKVEFNENNPCQFYNKAPITYQILNISKSIPQKDFINYLVWCYCYKKELIASMRFPSYSRGEDRVFLAQILLSRVNEIVVSSECCYGYRQRLGSNMHSLPNVQTLKDELSHRVDIIQMIDASGKKMPYKKTYWLERYCLLGYLLLVEGRSSPYTKAEQRELVDWFYHEQKRFVQAKSYSLAGKLIAKLHTFRLGKLWRKICSSKILFTILKWLSSPFSGIISLRGATNV
jgi:glycosyltransferase involved in cell wall biosynthesis